MRLKRISEGQSEGLGLAERVERGSSLGVWECLSEKFFRQALFGLKKENANQAIKRENIKLNNVFLNLPFVPRSVLIQFSKNYLVQYFE